MANAWGSGSYGVGEFGTGLENVTLVLDGQAMSANSGNLGTSTEVNLGWGRLAWGENAWGIAGDVLITGIGVSAGIGTGSVSIDVTVDDVVTGQQLNLNTGALIARGDNETQLSGFELTIEEGVIDPAPDVMLTGIGLTASSGTVDAYNEEGWGRDTWGSEVWGASGLWAFAPVTGIGLTANLGTVDAKPVTFVDLIGNGLTVEEGIVDPSPDATVVGIGLSASIAVGSVVEADANVSITGFALEIAQGQAELDAVTFAVLTGQELEIALNSVVAGASAEVTPNSIELTITTGSINIQAWQIVNTGSDVNWNIIDTAA
jgi:hypothetical protein